MASCGIERGGLAVQAARLVDFLLAFQRTSALAYSMRPMAEAGSSCESLQEGLVAVVLAGAVGQAGDQGADAADDLGVVGAERDVGVGVHRREPDGLFQAGAHLRRQAVRQRLDDRDALRVAARSRRPARKSRPDCRAARPAGARSVRPLPRTAPGASLRSARGRWRRCSWPCARPHSRRTPTARPSLMARSKSPAWKAIHASTSAGFFGNGSASPTCRRVPGARRPAASKT